MARDSSGIDLQSVLQAIKTSDVVERRVQLLTRLADSDISDKSDLVALAECLTTLWEDFTCLDISQCMLNKAVLLVAAKYVDSETFECLGQLLTIGTKASIWCGKHLKMTLLSTGDSQGEEEHSKLFFELLLDLLSFCNASISSLTKRPFFSEETLMFILEKFILEQLNLLKDSVSEVKRIHSFGSEVLTAAQLILDAVTQLCTVYFQSVDWEACYPKVEKDGVSTKCGQDAGAGHVINMTTCTIDILCELGVTAASNGGSLVTILNASWKGVVNLLQLGKGALAVKVNVSKIILTLISLANKSLKCAADVWSSSMKEPICPAEAKRTFVPAKFYLINAVRISLLYPSEAYSLYREMALSVLMMSTFAIFLTKEPLLRAASEVMVEFLEPTAFILLRSILNSTQLRQELKFQVLEWLFYDDNNLVSTGGEPSSSEGMFSLDAIFTINCEMMPQARVLLLGRVVLFVYLLKSSFELEEDIKLGLSRKLNWFFNLLIDEKMYSSVLVLQIPVLYGSGKSQELTWQPVFTSMLHALKSFMIVVSSSVAAPAWEEVLSFLLDNLFHPHVLCQETVMELWCFLARYAETEAVDDIIDKLSLFLRLIACSESVFSPGCALRILARLICRLLTYCSESSVYRVYCSTFNNLRSDVSSVLYVALLMEGFPLNLLIDDVKNKARVKLVADYFGFLESFDDESLKANCSGLFGAPVFALSAALRSLQVAASDIDSKTLKFLVSIIHSYRSSSDEHLKDHCLKLLSETLCIISNTKHLYEYDEMEEVIMELQKLFISRQAVLDTKLHLCKSDLSSFMAGLVHMEMVESDTCLKSSAVWELFHMLLKERHWAFVHLALATFGYFAARTSCNELWRFVPHDAALSFDLDSGAEVMEERFSSELRMFLDKEKMLLTSSEELALLMKEGLLLKEMVQKIQNIDLDNTEFETMQVDVGSEGNKKRKLPDGVGEGIELVRSGFKVIGDCLSKWQQQNLDSADLCDKFSSQYSRLEDVIYQMVSLTKTGLGENCPLLGGSPHDNIQICCCHQITSP